MGLGGIVNFKQMENMFKTNSKGTDKAKAKADKEDTRSLQGQIKNEDGASKVKDSLEISRLSRDKLNAMRQEESLSDTAKDYLAKLKEKYGNMDFIIGSYSNDGEAQQLMSMGDPNKEYTVLMDAATLERMATDSEYAAKMEGILDGAGQNYEQIKEELGEKADQVERLQIQIDDDGTVKYFAKLKESQDYYKELREKQAERKEESKEKEAKEKETKSNGVNGANKNAHQKAAQRYQAQKIEKEARWISGNSLEELISNLKNELDK
ncbi:MAG: DUF6033 family protein [Lachnospiraceae bacterium]|nr:DUF6033 family protein [Lachnospiraceae bacterium]